MKSPNNILRRILEDMKALRCAIDEIIACNPCGGGGSPTVGLLDVMPGTNITIDKTNPLKPIINAVWGGAVNGELIKVIENGKTGYGLRGVDTSVFGNTGTDAFNFGKSTTVSSTKGATGDRAVNFGLDNTTSGKNSLSIGNDNQNPYNDSIVVGSKFRGDSTNGYSTGNVFLADYTRNNLTVHNNIYASLIGGSDSIIGTPNATLNQSVIYQSVINGWNNNIYAGESSLAVGQALLGGAARCAIVGVANEDLTSTIATQKTEDRQAYNPRFIVGVGNWNSDSNTGTRANGFVVMSDGTASFPSLTNLMIDNSDGKSAVTKDWVIANSGGGGVQSVTGDGVDNTDPINPVLSYPTPDDIGIDLSEFTKFKNLLGNITFPYPRKYLFTIDAPLGFKEVGNIIFDEDLQKYICITSVYDSGVPNVTSPYLFTSIDGYTWVNEGELTGFGNSEDHYLVKHNGTYFVYSEKKSVTPPLVLDVQLHTSTDLTNWTDNGIVLPKGNAGDWDSSDTSSPTVLIKNGTFYMLFEGRGVDTTGIAEDGSVGLTNNGSIGFATSTDGINWVKSPLNPIIKGAQYQDAECAWGVNVVPDDLIELGGEWFLSCHAFNGKGWVNAIFYSTDLNEGWHDYLKTWQRTGLSKDYDGDGLMFLRRSNEIEMYLGVGAGMLLAEFNNSRGDEWFVSNTTGLHSYPIRAMSRNEVINFVGSANRNILLGLDESSSTGVQKIIKNKTTDFNLTIDLGVDVKLDGSTDSYVLRPQEVLRIYNTSTKNWEILSKSKIDTFDAIDSKVADEPSGSDKVVNMVSLTQAEYDAGTPKSDTFYIITDA